MILQAWNAQNPLLGIESALLRTSRFLGVALACISEACCCKIARQTPAARSHRRTRASGPSCAEAMRGDDAAAEMAQMLAVWPIRVTCSCDSISCCMTQLEFMALFARLYPRGEWHFNGVKPVELTSSLPVVKVKKKNAWDVVACLQDK